MNETANMPKTPQSPSETNKSASSPKRQAILVLGMHRSGTSALGGVVNALGAAAPNTLMVPDNANPRGYFESATFFVALDNLLASAGSRWDDWRQLDQQRLNSKAALPHRRRIKALLLEEFSNEPLILVKDPRLCRFVPFITSILAELNIDPVAIIMGRNPLEVAYSLKRRDNFPLMKSMLLWLRHVLDAEFYSRHTPRCFVRYDDFLLDWRSSMERATERTGVSWPDWSASAEIKIDQFLTRDLHRERVSLDEFKDHSEIAPWVREAYRILTTFAASGENKQLLDRMDLLRTKFDEACCLFGPALSAAEAAADNSLTAKRDTVVTSA